MKIAIYSDSLLTMNGAVKVDITLANHLGADIITSGYDPKINKYIKIKNNVIDLGNFSGKFSKAIAFYFETPLRFLFSKKLNYDVCIYTGISSIYASRNSTNNIWFCYTPDRLIYDLNKTKLKDPNLIKKLFFMLHILLFKQLDKNIIKNNFKKIIAQNKTVQFRIKKYYNLDSEIIYSPIDIKNYSFREIGNFYLSVSRLTKEKRMALVAKTFTKLKNRNLILVGDGPEKDTIKEIIKNSPNITLLSNVNKTKLIELYSNCYAVIYLPMDEDFGLVPLEAMASGKVCIASNEGGCKETIIQNKTGFLINASEVNLTQMIGKINKEKLYTMKNTCMKHAKNFDIKQCISKWQSVLKNL